jgi:hypothetical protein
MAATKGTQARRGPEISPAIKEESHERAKTRREVPPEHPVIVVQGRDNSLDFYELHPIHFRI